MSLQYDVYKKQLIANFKNINGMSYYLYLVLINHFDFLNKLCVVGSMNMNIIITCSNFTEKLPVPEILTTGVSFKLFYTKPHFLEFR